MLKWGKDKKKKVNKGALNSGQDCVYYVSFKFAENQGFRSRRRGLVAKDFDAGIVAPPLPEKTGLGGLSIWRSEKHKSATVAEEAVLPGRQPDSGVLLAFAGVRKKRDINLVCRRLWLKGYRSCYKTWSRRRREPTREEKGFSPLVRGNRRRRWAAGGENEEEEQHCCCSSVLTKQRRRHRDGHFWVEGILVSNFFYKGMEWPFLYLLNGMAIPPLSCKPNAVMIIPLEWPFHSDLHYSKPNAT